MGVSEFMQRWLDARNLSELLKSLSAEGCEVIAPKVEDGAIVSFVFNLGAGSLQRSTLRRKVNRREHEAVPAEFRRWVWAGGRKLKGLMRRREAEAALFKD